MRCPFLREAQVKYCQGSAIKKMIVRTSEDPGDERCSSPDYVNCPSLKQHREDHPLQTRCPFLQESLVQYCAASSVTKYVPYSESSIIRCGNDGHRYCDLYFSMAAPAEVRADQDVLVDGIRLPENLAYTANHMWLDQTDDGTCHIGVDAFLTKLFHRIEAISFITPKASVFPSVVLTVKGADLQLVFPFPINVTGTNMYLRAKPQKLVSHPYSFGWLFEGTIPDISSSTQSTAPASTILRGSDAAKWMKQEVRHLNKFVHDQIIPGHVADQPMISNGGVVHPEFLDQLNRQELLHIFNEFFSPYASWRKSK
jgi:glycine cleavage system H lipoate-binding protein